MFKTCYMATEAGRGPPCIYLYYLSGGRGYFISYTGSRWSTFMEFFIFICLLMVSIYYLFDVMIFFISDSATTGEIHIFMFIILFLS